VREGRQVLSACLLILRFIYLDDLWELVDGLGELSLGHLLGDAGLLDGLLELGGDLGVGEGLIRVVELGGVGRAALGVSARAELGGRGHVARSEGVVHILRVSRLGRRRLLLPNDHRVKVLPSLHIHGDPKKKKTPPRIGSVRIRFPL